jgi:hypothetical protein
MVPDIQAAEVGDSLELKNLRPAWTTKQNSVSKNKRNLIFLQYVLLL